MQNAFTAILYIFFNRHGGENFLHALLYFLSAARGGGRQGGATW